MRPKPLCADNIMLLSDSELSVILNAAPLSSHHIAAFAVDRSPEEQRRILSVLFCVRRARVGVLLKQPQTISSVHARGALRRIDSQLQDLSPSIHRAFMASVSTDYVVQRGLWRQQQVVTDSAYPGMALPAYELKAPAPPVLARGLDEVSLPYMEEYLSILWRYLRMWGPRPIESVRTQFDSECWECIATVYDDSLSVSAARRRIREIVSAGALRSNHAFNIAREICVLTTSGVFDDPRIFSITGTDSPSVAELIQNHGTAVDGDELLSATGRVSSLIANPWAIVAAAYCLANQHGRSAFEFIAKQTKGRLPRAQQAALEFSAVGSWSKLNSTFKKMKGASASHWETIGNMFDLWLRVLRGEITSGQRAISLMLRQHCARTAMMESLWSRDADIDEHFLFSGVAAVAHARPGLPEFERLVFASDDNLRARLRTADISTVGQALSAVSEGLWRKITDNLSPTVRGLIVGEVARWIGAATIAQIAAAQREILGHAVFTPGAAPAQLVFLPASGN